MLPQDLPISGLRLVLRWLQAVQRTCNVFELKVEFNDYCKRVLHCRQEDGYLDDGPIFSDVKQFTMKQLNGRVEPPQGVLLGFPCQAFRF